MIDQNMRGKKYFQVYSQNGKGYKPEKVMGYTVTAMARELGIPREWLAYRRELLPEPAFTSGARQYWSEQQFEDIKNLYDMSPHNLQQTHWNMTAAAEELDVPRIVIEHHMKQGHIKEPSIKTSHGNFWTPKEFSEVRDYFALRKRTKDAMLQLHVGLRELGATDSEIQWANKHRSQFPPPDVDLGGRKGRYYKRRTLQRILRQTRTELAT